MCCTLFYFCRITNQPGDPEPSDHDDSSSSDSDSSSSDSNIGGRHESPVNRDAHPDFTIEEVSNVEVEMEVLQHEQLIADQEKVIAKLKQDLEIATRLNQQYLSLNDLPGKYNLVKN